MLVGVASTAIIIAPLVITGSAYLQRHRTFPTLVDFDSPLSTYFLGAYSAITVARVALPGDLPGGGGGTVGLHARVLDNGDWGLALWEPQPDWRAYQSLSLDLVNPTDAPLHLQLHIRDRRQSNDRQSGYRARIEVPSRSRATRTIPIRELSTAKGRANVDTAIVDSLVLTPISTNRAREFYIMRIWLE